MYKRLAEVRSDEQIAEVLAELEDRYGTPPKPVTTLLQVARLRVAARAARLTDVTVQANHVRFGPVELAESAQLRLDRVYPKSIVKAGPKTMLVPRPRAGGIGGAPLRDEDLLTWCHQVIDTVLAPVAAPA
jgi:transcription-repair coupling factor (superfamily II helicase)